MSRSVIFKTLVLLAVMTHVTSQYIDFFQGFSAFLQPFQTTRRSEVVTKRPLNKQRYQETIFFETDDYLKPKQNGRTVNPFNPTTVKPKRTKITTKSPWFQDFSNLGNEKKNERTTKNLEYVYDNQNNRKIDENNNVYDYNYEVANAKSYTLRPSDFVTQKPTNSRPIFNSHTTRNPLLHRPGVRPAPVDVNRPPITNRPVTRPPFVPVTSTQKPVESEHEPSIEIGPDEDEMSEAERRRFIEIAEQKCDEYKAMKIKKVVALPLAPTSHGVELNVSTCRPVQIPLIIGGKVVTIQEFPHMGLVGWKNIQASGYSWKCGATLISEQFVLTAGHCTYHDKDYNVISGPPHAVQLGSSLLNGRDSTVVSISNVIRHPKFKLRRSYYDVALIKLVSVVTFSKSISPACLGVPPPVGDRVITTGWGRTEFGGDSSEELRSVSVSIWDMGQCREVWGTSRKLPEGPSPASQLCAGEKNGGKDTCQGDSGGPAQIQDGCTWRVVAVTSVGRSCGAADTPALYAKIPRAFIASQVFTNVKLNKNNGYNGNNGDRNSNNGFNNGNHNSNNGFNNDNNGFNNGNRFNRDEGNANNYANTGNNDRYNGNSANNGYGNGNNANNERNGNQNSDRDHAVNRPGNHQTIGSNNQFGVQSTGSKEVLNRPGNHQTLPDRGVVAINHLIQSSGNREINRPGNHQTIAYNNRETTSESYSNIQSHDVRRPGNHQNIGNNDRSSSIYFEDSRSSERDVRPGNHQSISKDRPNFDNSQSSDVIRPGKHQALNNRGSESGSQNSGSNQDRPGNHQRVETSNNERYNEGVRNNERNHGTTTVSYYYNDNRNVQKRPDSNFGIEYTTESAAYNRNNGYNDNNNEYNRNNEYTVIASRPWWN